MIDVNSIKRARFGEEMRGEIVNSLEYAGKCLRDEDVCFFSNRIDTSVSDVAISFINKNKIKLTGTSTGSRRLLCFNGQNEVAITSDAFARTLPAGKYKFSISTTGHNASGEAANKLDGTYSTFADRFIIHDGDELELAAPVMIGLLIVNGEDYGTDSDPTYVEVHISAANAVDNLSRVMLDTALTYQDPPPMLTIIDDDGNYKFFTQLLPIVIEKNVPLTTAVVANRPDDVSTSMTWEQVQECYLAGAPICVHSYDHILTSDAETREFNLMCRQIVMAKAIFVRHGIQPQKAMVYPHATGTVERFRDAVGRVFEYGIHSRGNVMNYVGSTRELYIKRYAVEPTATLAELKSLIDSCQADGGWMIWCIHTSSGNWSQASADNLSGAVDYARSIGVDIVTPDYGCARYCR